MTEMEEPFKLEGLTTGEDLLRALRRGNSQTLEIKVGDFAVQCRLLNASEEATIIVKASQAALKKNPTGLKQEVFESYEVMKSILSAATNVGGVPNLPMSFLEALNQAELTNLYDAYVTLNHTINPSFQELPQARLVEIVEGIKKKTKASSDLFTWELAGVGKYFLDQILPHLATDNAAGSL